MKKYSNQVTLRIKGPFLTSSGHIDSYGVDKAFSRNENGDPVIPDTHIKGKLRMSLEELAILIKEPEIDIHVLFGTESKENSYEPQPGILKISSFALQSEEASGTRTRTSIDEATSTAAEQQLRTVEDLFASDSISEWSGRIEYFAENDTKALSITKKLGLGFRWLPNLGAEKGVGFGRLYEVVITKPMPIESGELSKPENNPDLVRLHLAIRLLQPMTIGGIKARKVNFIRSERIITGGAIKGALAAGLNRGHGIQPVYQALSQEAADQYPGYQDLVSNYEKIRFTHAFPSYDQETRPVKVPISQVDLDAEKFDVALMGDCPMIEGKAPSYFIDWKGGEEYFEGATPREIFKTRSAIDDKSRRSQDGQLFSYSAVTSNDKDGNEIFWVSEVDFSGIEQPSRRQSALTQFIKAVPQYLDRIGRKGSAIEVMILPGEAKRTMDSLNDLKEDILIVTLQSEAIILNPEQYRKVQRSSLKDLYSNYWREVSSVNGVQALELVDFFANQCFKGGYLYHRYLGAVEREVTPRNYHPFLLTNPGTVFVLNVKDESAASALVEGWKAGGLPLPNWAVLKFDQFPAPLWKVCPFVPENGFGEICVNLTTHWERKPPI